MSKEKKYNYFYIIVNRLNGSYYKGVHSTDDLDDGYMGSGRRLKMAIKKYGVENLEKTIIKFFSTAAEMFDYEKEQITPEDINNPRCYNIAAGGHGGFTGTHSDKIKQLISEQKKGTTSWNKGLKLGPSWNKGVPMKEESKRKLSQARTGNHYHTEESKRKISIASKGRRRVAQMMPITISETMPIEVMEKYSLSAGDQFECIRDMRLRSGMYRKLVQKCFSNGWIIKT